MKQTCSAKSHADIGRRGDPHDLRPARPRGRQHELRDQLDNSFPKVGPLMD